MTVPTIHYLTTPHNSNNVYTPIGYELPFRHNRGKPPNRYSREVEDQRLSYSEQMPIMNLQRHILNFSKTLQMSSLYVIFPQALMRPQKTLDGSKL